MLDLTPAQRATALGISWEVAYLDGTKITNLEKHWSEIALPYQVNEKLLYCLTEPVESLVLYVAGKAFPMSWHYYHQRGYASRVRFYHYYTAGQAIRPGDVSTSPAPMPQSHTMGAVLFDLEEHPIMEMETVTIDSAGTVKNVTTTNFLNPYDAPESYQLR